MHDERLLEAFGDVVRAVREQRGWSQERLAAEASLHRTYIGSVERGERNITLSSIWKIAKALRLEPSALLARVEASR